MDSSEIRIVGNSKPPVIASASNEYIMKSDDAFNAMQRERRFPPRRQSVAEGAAESSIVETPLSPLSRRRLLRTDAPTAASCEDCKPVKLDFYDKGRSLGPSHPRGGAIASRFSSTRWRDSAPNSSTSGYDYGSWQERPLPVLRACVPRRNRGARDAARAEVVQALGVPRTNALGDRGTFPSGRVRFSPD